MTKKPGPKKPDKLPASDDDGTLWQRVARDVDPLKDRARRRPAVAPPAPPPLPETSKPKAKAKPKARPPARVPSAPELRVGAARGLDRRMAMRLRRGRLPIEARLDLHGMTLAEAEMALGAFLRGAHGRGLRCVLVITGKGRGGKDLGGKDLGGKGAGVIRAALPGWLNGAGLRPLVVAFTQAQPADGGGGAFYVYLRRARDR